MTTLQDTTSITNRETLFNYLLNNNNDIIFFQIYNSALIVDTTIQSNIINFQNSYSNKCYYGEINSNDLYSYYISQGQIENPFILLYIKPYYIRNDLTSLKFTIANNITNLINAMITNESIINNLSYYNYLYYTPYDITIAQIYKNGITKKENISTILNEMYIDNTSILYNKKYKYIEINNSLIYSTYSTTLSVPLLAIFLKINNTPIEYNKYLQLNNITDTILKNNITSYLNVLSFNFKLINDFNLYLNFIKRDIIVNNNIIFFQITKNGIDENNYVINQIITYNSLYNKIYNYIYINSNTIYNYYNKNDTQHPIILLFMKDYYTNNIDDLLYTDIDDSININTIFTIIENTIKYPFTKINSTTLNLINYMKYTINELIFFQIIKPTVQENTNINTVLNNFGELYNKYYTINNINSIINYSYSLINSSEIFNYYNTNNTKPILILIVKKYYNIENTFQNNFLRTPNNYIILSSPINIAQLETYIINILKIPFYSDDDLFKYIKFTTTYAISFFQIANNSMTQIENIENILVKFNINYKQNYEYIKIKNNNVFTNILSTSTKPILLLAIKEYNNDYKKNDYTVLYQYKYVYIDNTININTIKLLIQSAINNINDIIQLKKYLKYTTYDTTFIRIININPIINKEYIISLLSEYNKLYNNNYEFIQLQNISINTFYKPYIKQLPSLMIFKKINYNEETGLIPCKYLSGENSILSNTNMLNNINYLNKNILQIQIFLKNGLKT